MSEPRSSPPLIEGYSHVKGIGGGGFADVFLYTQHSTGRGVAVKVLRAEHLSDQSLQQFETEARVMAGVSTHPFIVTIHDAGIANDGRPYLVMEMYPHPHFGKRARGGHLPLSEVLRVSVQICSAVETAHRAGIIHRDIKPANILTSDYGEPGLTDFGLAGVQGEDGLSTATAVSYGFAAPEVVNDPDATGSVSSDVYALGATIYNLLAGRTPIEIPGQQASPADLAFRTARGEVQPLRREDVPRSLQHLINAALSVAPSARPPSAQDLATALRDIEQELRLPPTPLTVLNELGGPLTPAPSDRTGTSSPNEATFRRPRVVRVNDSDEPISRAPGPEKDNRFDHQPGSEYESGHTIRRHLEFVRPDPEPTPVDPVPRIEETQPATTRSWTPVVAAVTLATVVLAVAISVLLGGGGSGRDGNDTRTTVALPPAGEVSDEVGGSLAPPSNVMFERQPDGALQLSWEPPRDAEGSVTYNIFSVGGTDDSEPLATTVNLSASLTPGSWSDPAAAGDEICFVIEAVNGARTSDTEACTTPTLDD